MQMPNGWWNRHLSFPHAYFMQGFLRFLFLGHFNFVKFGITLRFHSGERMECQGAWPPPDKFRDHRAGQDIHLFHCR